MSSVKLLASFQSFLKKVCIGEKPTDNLQKPASLNTEEVLADGANQCNFLLAVSGGLDSIVLADLFFKSNYIFTLAHCNFNLRGDESNDDENFVKQLADKYKAQFIVQRFDTTKLSESENISIQMAARNLRYEWFEKLRIERHFDFIVTAHHREDSTETVLLNITRGTGLEGLKGIAPKNNFIIRPMLFAMRKQIFEYANENNLQWHEDSSNATTDYQRNFIRHKIIPLLKEINPSVHDSISKLSDYSTESLFLLNETIEKYQGELCLKKGDDFIIESKNLMHHPAKRTLLYCLLIDFHFNSSQIESISECVGKSGMVFYSFSHRLIVNRYQIIVSVFTNNNPDESFVINECDAELHLNGKIIQVLRLNNFNPADLQNNNSSTAVMDASKIKFPLIMRRWQKGDYFYPLGMNQRKKISDYFTDEKFSIPDKEKTWLVVNNPDPGLIGPGEIVWIVNHRLDHRYRVTDETKTVIQLKYINSTLQNG